MNNTLLGSVTTTIQNQIATITFSHPSHNSLPGKLLAKLAQAITDAGQNEEVNIIVLQSGGDRTFCAGASFDELVAIRDFESGKKFFLFNQLIPPQKGRKGRSLPKTGTMIQSDGSSDTNPCPSVNSAEMTAKI